MPSIDLYTYKHIWIRNWLENPWGIWPREAGKGIPRGEVLALGLFLFLRRQELNVAVVGRSLSPAQPSIHLPRVQNQPSVPSQWSGLL